MSRQKNNKQFYRIRSVEDAKRVASNHLIGLDLDKVIDFGLPEIDDRFDIWRVPLKAKNGEKIGEIVIDALSTFIDKKKTTSKELLENRLLGRNHKKPLKRRTNEIPHISTLRNTIGMGDSEELLKNIPNGSVDLIFTSPPYYNAKPEYSEYLSYESYLLKMRRIIHECSRVLNEGRFFVLNISPILIRRANRNESSKRIAVPFDFHQIFINENFDFIDDIIWVKPEGAGWASGRGRRFSADRNPLQYKPVPVTEYILVYRKKTDKLIDWHIRKHPEPTMVKESKIEDGYEVTNIWKITPSHSKIHPAIFPLELAEKVIKYYSFKNDVVLDPFGGIGTTALASIKLGRRFALLEKEKKYILKFRESLMKIADITSLDINWINIEPPSISSLF